MKPLHLLLSVVAVACLAAVPLGVTNTYYLHLIETIMIYAILLFGLDIVVGYTGQVSLGHAGLFGIGSYVAGVLFFHLQLPIWLTLPAAILIAAAFGAVLALPALRVTGPYLAMVTLAFGTIIQILINEMTFLTEGPLGIKIPKPSIGGHVLNKSEYFWLVAALLVLSLIVVHRILKSHLGRSFEAARQPDRVGLHGRVGLPAQGFRLRHQRRLRRPGRALYSYSEQYISPNTYNFELTILFLLAIIMGGRKSRTGALLGAAIIVLLPKMLDDIATFRLIALGVAVVVTVGGAMAVARGRTEARKLAVPVIGTIALAVFSYWLDAVTDWRLTIFGAMILFVVYYLPDGIVGFVRNLFFSGRALSVKKDLVKQQDAVPDAARGNGETLLVAKGVLMQFGGLKALNQVDLTVKRGTIHGLIGPNGSGKSTMMNVLTGIYVPTAGSVDFSGKSLVGLAPADIAASGVARTFQNVQLFGEMTALENVLVGLHHTFNTGLAGIALRTPGWKREEQRARPRPGAAGVRRPGGPGQRGSAQPALRQAAPAGNRPRARAGPAAAAAGRAGRRPDRARHRRAAGHHPQGPRPRRHADPDRAPHGRGHGRVRHRVRAGLRPEDRRGPAQ